jgi:hypothetical protein
MKKIKINGTLVEMYDSVDSLPAENYINHSRLAMLDVGIGSDLDAVTRHWQAIARLCAKGDTGALNKVLSNYLHSLQFIVSNTSPEMMSFVSFIRSIDGKLVEDYSDETAKEIIGMLSKKGLTVGVVRQFMDMVKKKLNRKSKPTDWGVA